MIIKPGISVQVLALERHTVYPSDGDKIPRFVGLESFYPPGLRSALLHAMPSYLSFESYPREHLLNIDYDWLLSFCDVVGEKYRDTFLLRLQFATDLVATHIDIREFDQFLMTLISRFVIRNATTCLIRQDQQRQERRRPGFVALLKHGLGLESVLGFTHIRFEVTVDANITAERFKVATGREPMQDDLERCNCKQAGEFGHWGCGWCATCDKPRFDCGHLLQGT